MAINVGFWGVGFCSDSLSATASGSCNLMGYIQTADYVITGEGRIDGQTIFGKTPMGVAKIAKNYNKPVIGIAGCLTLDAAVVYDHGIDAIFSVLHRACTTEEAYN